MSVKSIILKLAAALCVTALLIGCVVLLSREEVVQENEFLEVYHSEDVADEVIVKGNDSFLLYRKGSEWVMEGMEQIPVQGAYAFALEKSMRNIYSTMLVEENSGRLSDYGFDSPTVEITLGYPDGEETVRIGKRSGVYYYVNIASNSDVYLVDEKDLYMAFLNRIDYMDNSVMSFDSEKVEKLSFGDVVLEKNNGTWYEVSPYERIADESVVKEVLLKLSDVSGTEILAKKEMMLKNGERLTVKQGEDYSFDVYSTEKGMGVVPCGFDYVYIVPDMAFLSLGGFDFVIKYIAPVAISSVKELEFIEGNRKTVLSIEAPDSEAPIFYVNGCEADESSFRGFYQKLMGLTITKECSSWGKCEREIIIREENGSVTHLEFLAHGESEYAVRINGETNFAIGKKTVTDVFKALDDIVVL